jgi:murein DD-endopeptidase MepM/ murein hydrolase activator NlpD
MPGDSQSVSDSQPRIRIDYKSAAPPPRTRLHLRWLVAGLTLPVLVALVSLPFDDAGANLDGTAPGLADNLRHLDLALPTPEAGNTSVDQKADPTPRPLRLVVKPGDSLASMFSRNGLSATDLHYIMAGKGEASRLRKLRPGDVISVVTDSAGRVQHLSAILDQDHILQVSRKGDSYASRLATRPVQRHASYAHAVITSSLFDAGAQAGLSDNLVMNLAQIFQWDIDFVQDIREGDQFTLIYEELYRDGEKIRDGDILAAEFVNQGTVYRAVRFTDPKGRTDYYTPDGHSVRKEFIRAPVDFTRISSGFSRARYHPILGRVRKHEGVDYAAPTGTPIKAAGDGKIIFRGRKGGYGNCIIIRHGVTYSTLYGHMSRFRGGLHVGSRVRQGQVIGYVGMTGLATGPHLHYEFRVNGVHRNPRTVKLPSAAPVPSQYVDAFHHQTDSLLAQLDFAHGARMVASSGGE